MEQELILLSVVGTKYVSQEVISIFQAGSFVNFNAFSPLLSLLPAEYQGEVWFNTLTDSFQYHPSLQGKMFLANIACHICFTLLSLLGFSMCAVLGLRFAYCRKLSQSYLFCGVINSVQACFIDIVLCGLVQLRNFTFEYDSFYATNCLAACFAVVFEAAFLAFSVAFFIQQPVCVLVSSGCRSRYGALYEDLKGTATALSMATFHSLRVFVLISLLVLGAARPVFQSGAYIVSASLGLGWDIGLSPYEGRLLTAQMLFFGVAKVAAAAGYVILAIPTVSRNSAEGTYVYESVVLLGAMGVGVMMCILQVALQIWEQVREHCKRRRDHEKIYGVGLGTDALSSQNTLAVRRLSFSSAAN